MKSPGQRESQKHEARLAERFGGRCVAASGAFWSRKGDVRSGELLWEAKWTSKAQFSLRRDTLRKIVTEAVLAGRMPALSLSFSGEEQYVVLTEDDFLTLFEAAGGDTSR